MPERGPGLRKTLRYGRSAAPGAAVGAFKQRQMRSEEEIHGHLAVSGAPPLRPGSRAVPDGFCLTTAAYRGVAERTDVELALAALAQAAATAGSRRRLGYGQRSWPRPVPDHVSTRSATVTP